MNLSWTRPRPRLRTVANVSVMSLASTALIVAAATSEGYRATNVDLDDGSVWVVNEAAGQIARLNIQIDEFDFGVPGEGPLDVVQDGRQIYIGDATGVRQVVVTTGAVKGPVEGLPIAGYQIGGGTAAYLDATTGALWTGTDAANVASEYPRKPVGQLPVGSRIVVTANGAVLAIDPSAGTWFEVPLDEQRRPAFPTTDDTTPADSAPDTDLTSTTAEPAAPEVSVPDTAPAVVPEQTAALPRPVEESTVVTAVGDRLVFLDADGTVWTPTAVAGAVPGDDPRLQPAGPDDDRVLVATTSGLYAVPLDGGDVEQLIAHAGTPAAPVRAARCAYGAWSGADPWFGKRCDGSADAKGGTVPTPEGGYPNRFVIRVNGVNVALNGPADGGTWTEKDGRVVAVGDWGQLQGGELDDAAANASNAVSDEAEQECADAAAAPIAADDQLGARYNRQTILDVLGNDSDANCDPLLVTDPLLDDISVGTVATVDNGQHVLYSPSAAVLDGTVSMPFSFTFTYTVVDPARTESNRVTATVRVTDPEVTNAPPELRSNGDTKRSMRASVESGGEIRYNVLADWVDPDGDDLRVSGASVPSGRGAASFTPDGVVRFNAAGVSAGIQQVDVTVTDGVPTSDDGPVTASTAQLEVSVLPEGSPIKPQAQNDFATVMVGATTVVHPKANDVDGNGDDINVMLKQDANGTIQQPDGLTVSYDVVDDALTISATVPGLYAVQYSAVDASPTRDTDTAVVLIDVPESGETNQPPVAVPDRVVARPGRVVNVDVLTNDIDDDGDLLAVVRATAGGVVSDDDGGLRVSVIERRTLQIELVPPTDGSPLVGPFFVSYTIDDGNTIGELSHQSIGTLTVLVDPTSGDQPPVASFDTVTVRTGDVATVAVLANDIDPDSDRLVLDRLDETSVLAAQEESGLVAWTDGQKVKVRGGAPGGPYVLTYVASANGVQAGGVKELRVTVTALPEGTTQNEPPMPQDIELRVARGATVRVPIPLDGIDRDGDSVTVQSATSTGGQTGASVVVDPVTGAVTYTADSRSAFSADSFTYQVVDALGAPAEATVRVLVLDIDQSPPVAHDDVVRARPGRIVTVPVRANDVDADDDALVLADQPFLDADGNPGADPQHPDAVQVLADASDPGGKLVVTTPAEGEPALTERYVVTDGHGGFGDAYVRVIADPDAPNVAPVTRGKTLTVADIADLDVVTVDVLADGITYDPDDAGAVIEVGLPANQPGSSAQLVDGALDVTVLETAQIVVYTVTDADPVDPRTSYGIVRVPGRKANNPPALTEVGRNDGLVNFRQISNGPPLTFVLSDLVVDPDGDQVVLTDDELEDDGSGTVLRDGEANDRFVYTPAANKLEPYTGSVTFTVVDRPGASDAQVVTFTVHFQVDAYLNSPPEVLNNGNLSVSQDVDDVATYDLSPLVRDAEGDSLTWTYAGGESSVAGLDVRLSGTQLTVRAVDNQSVQPGESRTIAFTVTDGLQDHQPVHGTVAVVIVPTKKGLPVAATVGSLDAVINEPSAPVDVLAQSTNPVPSEPMSIETVTATGGSVNCAAACGQGSIVFTPNAIGQFVVTYTVKDAFDRTATGTITYVVKGRPLAPGVPQIGSVGDGVVRLSWTPADLQGGTLTEYVITAVETGATKTSTTTSVDFDGLKNAEPYRFTVYAVNEVGNGEVSGESNAGIPDRVPDPPINPRFTDYGSGTLMLAWDPPATAANYSAIIGYEVKLDGYGVIPVDGNVTTLVQTGLSNGTDYTFSVRARNSATTQGGFGAFSVSSASERPSTSPTVPLGVTAVAAGDGGTPRIKVTWNPPASDGGRPVVSYRVCQSGTQTCQTGDNTRQVTFTVTKGQTYNYTVQAKNSDKHTPDGPVSAPSVSVTGTVTPGPPTITNVASGDSTLTVSANLGDNGGCSSSFLQYSRNGTTWQTSNVFSGLTNGTSYTITARMKLGAGCEQFVPTGVAKESAASAGFAQTPYGPLGQPSISANVSGQSITWSWNANQGANGRPWTATVSGEGCSWQIGPGQNQTGSCPTSPGWDSGQRTVTITVSAPGVPSMQASAPAATGSKPKPSVSVGTGSLTTGGSCSDNQGCYTIAFSISGGTGGPYTVYCWGRTNWGWEQLAGPFSHGNGGGSCTSGYSYAGRAVIVSVDGTISGGPDNPTVSSGGSYGFFGPWPTD